MPNSGRRQESGSAAKSAALVGLGAVVGALAAGAAWYFSSEEEQPQRQQQQRYQPNHPVHQSNPPQPVNATEKDDDDEKDGTVKVCEICFVSFADLKECGIQIVATPCGHVYCRDCIIGALSVKPECPHCRNEVREPTLTRLFL